MCAIAHKRASNNQAQKRANTNHFLSTNKMLQGQNCDRQSDPGIFFKIKNLGFSLVEIVRARGGGKCM